MMWTPSLPDSRSWTLRSRHLDVRRAAMPGHFPHHGGCWNRRARRHQIRAVLSMAERHPEANRQETDHQSQRRHPAVIFNANQFKRISRPRCVESPSAGKRTPWQLSLDTTWHGRNTSGDIAWCAHNQPARHTSQTVGRHQSVGWRANICRASPPRRQQKPVVLDLDLPKAGFRNIEQVGGSTPHGTTMKQCSWPTQATNCESPIETKETLHHIPVGYTSSINSVTQL